jgi:hypothetical protein
MARNLFDGPRPLEFEIFSVPLDRALPYEAISYTWGSRTQTAEIIINDKRIRTTANAFAELQKRGSYKHPRTVRIDSVCVYSHLTAMKHLGTFKIAPRFLKGFHFTYLANQIGKYFLSCFYIQNLSLRFLFSPCLRVLAAAA